jgi:cyclin B
MFENQKIILRRNNSNSLAKPQQINISNRNEKNIQNYTKKISVEHREFGNDLTNLALTVFGNSNISQNKSILKAIEIIKANKKNKERSREKSLLKEKKKNNIKTEKNLIKEVKKSKGYGTMQWGKNINGKKNEINKNNREVLCDKKNNSNDNKCDNINKISEFKLENNQKEETTQNIHKNIYINKISEVNIKLDNEIILNNNLQLKSGILSNIKNNTLSNDKINEKYDLQFAEEYQEEIIPYLISLEYKKRINPNYMLKQSDINEKMRMILIDWLIEVHLKFKLLPETLFLTINFIDRYLQNNQTKRDKLQLIAVSSLLIACKYEEIYPPEISSFVYITDNAYKKEDILNYEIKILEDLEYDLTYPSILRYFEIVTIKLGLPNDKTFYNKMMCLSELCLSKLIFYNFTYLELVLACALFLFEKNLFMTQSVISHFNLGEDYQKLEKINNCIFEIKKLLEFMNENKNIFKGVRQKYALEKYGCISMNEFF